jgi:Zn-finger nucleic acid-binding protein
MSDQPMLCPSCRSELAPTAGRHGIVWLCATCRGGAATLPILRQVAPRDFVNQLWQAALQNGRPSSQLCPSCTQPFTTFEKSRARVEPHLEVCTRCYWVWLSSASLKQLSQIQEPAVSRKIGRELLPLDLGRGGVETDAKEALLRLAAKIILGVL